MLPTERLASVVRVKSIYGSGQQRGPVPLSCAPPPATCPDAISSRRFPGDTDLCVPPAGYGSFHPVLAACGVSASWASERMGGERSRNEGGFVRHFTRGSREIHAADTFFRTPGYDRYELLPALVNTPPAPSSRHCRAVIRHVTRVCLDDTHDPRSRQRYRQRFPCCAAGAIKTARTSTASGARVTFPARDVASVTAQLHVAINLLLLPVRPQAQPAGA